MILQGERRVSGKNNAFADGIAWRFNEQKSQEKHEHSITSAVSDFPAYSVFFIRINLHHVRAPPLLLDFRKKIKKFTEVYR